MQDILGRRPRHGILAAAATIGFLIGGILVTAAQVPARIPMPGYSSTSGTLTLTEAHRQRIWARIDEDKPEMQPVPQAFAPAVGMTAPPELRLTKLPVELRDLPGITEIHQYVLLDNGLLMIIGDRQLVTATISRPKRPSPARAP